MSAPLDGGAPATLASGQIQPKGLIVQGGSLYWVASDSLMSVALDGGAPVTVATLPPPYPPSYDGTSPSLALAVDGQNAYWVSSTRPYGGLPRGAGRGGFVTLAGTDNTYAVATDGTSISTRWAPSVLRAPIDGGAPTTLVAAPAMIPSWSAFVGVSPSWGEQGSQLLLDATHLYWNTGGGVAILTPR